MSNIGMKKRSMRDLSLTRAEYNAIRSLNSAKGAMIYLLLLVKPMSKIRIREALGKKRGEDKKFKMAGNVGRYVDMLEKAGFVEHDEEAALADLNRRKNEHHSRRMRRLFGDRYDQMNDARKERLKNKYKRSKDMLYVGGKEKFYRATLKPFFKYANAFCFGTAFLMNYPNCEEIYPYTSNIMMHLYPEDKQRIMNCPDKVNGETLSEGEKKILIKLWNERQKNLDNVLYEEKVVFRYLGSHRARISAFGLLRAYFSLKIKDYFKKDNERIKSEKEKNANYVMNERTRRKRTTMGKLLALLYCMEYKPFKILANLLAKKSENCET